VRAGGLGLKGCRKARHYRADRKFQQNV